MIKTDPRILEAKRAEIKALKDRVALMPKDSQQRQQGDMLIKQYEQQYLWLVNA